MRKAAFIFLSFLFLIPFAVNAEVKEVKSMLKNIHWLGHDTFKITGEKVIYTDPFKIKKADSADIILITHEHYDHCSPEDKEDSECQYCDCDRCGLREKTLRKNKDC